MSTPQSKFVKLRTCGNNWHASYIELVDHPHELVSGCVRRTVRVHPLITPYDGPGIAIDFDENDRAIGIEILYPYDDDDSFDDEENGTQNVSDVP